MAAWRVSATVVATLVLIGGLATAAAAHGLAPSHAPIPSPDAPEGRPAAPSCEAVEWPPTLVSCPDARASASLGMVVAECHIWLTTLGAVDGAWSPGRQVADHPVDPATPVWVFVYDGFQPPIRYANEAGQEVESAPETRLLHVVRADHPVTLDGGFVYLYGWSELGDPTLPAVMPAAAPG